MHNILCVDDTKANLIVLESLFASYEIRYNILMADGGYEALEILLTKKVDLILLDVMMPEIDGFETAKLINANKKTKDIPIIFLTAKRDDVTIQNAFKFGVDYLSKPYDEYELFARINVQLKLVKAKYMLEEQVKFNQFVLDSQNSILFIQTNNGLISANKSFLNFFNVKDIEEFNTNNTSIVELFMTHDTFFCKKKLKNDKNWLDIIDLNSDKEYNVLIMDTNIFEPKAFRVEVNKIQNTNKYVISLTDITAITTKSKQFENKATYDTLTNIYNRSKFNELFEEHYNLFKRYNKPICFAIFDIDFFKDVNDNYGHVVGDETLITFSQTINEAVRNTDTFARWGGEEFTLLMPETTIEDGYVVVEKLRKLIENIDFKTIGQKTCSIGITQFIKDDTIDKILIRADEALYEAKENGRNKVYIR